MEKRKNQRIYSLGGLLQHVVTVPAGNGDESDRLGVVTDLLDEVGGLLDDFVETILAPLLRKKSIKIGIKMNKLD